jgi:hypothetical protein
VGVVVHVIVVVIGFYLTAAEPCCAFAVSVCDDPGEPGLQ